MKRAKVLFWLVISFCFYAQAQEIFQLPVHPLRKIGENVYSLQAIYDWNKLPITDRTPRPLQNWIGFKTNRRGKLLYRVEQIIPEGLILRSSGELYWLTDSFGYDGQEDYESHQPFLLKNYPAASKLVDGNKIEFLALRDGSFKYTGIDGASHTIASYDYGFPYKPSPSNKNIPNLKSSSTN